MSKKYIKDFYGWGELKRKINSRDRKLFFYEREVWWCSMGVNVGSEQDGKGYRFMRPVIIYKKINDNLFLGIPLTKTLREDDFHISFYLDYDFSTAILTQIRIFDSRRLDHRKGWVSEYIYSKIKKALAIFLR